ncbi:fimbrial protein [Morganella morganii]|uniref:fimbrial protein n=1 Tax=Morganella morganii TaxID=582 RepID=UPI001A35D68A|nr:fimbrial protein [Morganella morganii]MCU6212775.1 fimbrial protein [Morganella morganii]MCU6226282.1 fimbrial protein [Morganella morganii]MCU6235250.1 fimbrial protein [Morganella morganii]MCU6237944.1 fimbrial protein [Morganella morganii]MCU6272333.1 fimbrial protein [Morganella morganii]
MTLNNKHHWLMPVLLIVSAQAMADCANTESGLKTAESHLQARIEGKISAGTLLATDVLQVDGISACNNSAYEELRLVTTRMDSDSPPAFFRMINGVPAYYLNKDYAYSVRLDGVQPYTSQGGTFSVENRNGFVYIPRALISVYAATDNPEPLRLASAQAGLIKNDRHETIARLKLSANIDTVEICVINTPQIVYDFNNLELSDFPAETGRTAIRADNTISVSCSNDKTTKRASIVLSEATRFALADRAVIASTNPAIGFALYYNDEQITAGNKVYLGNMQKQLNASVTAYIYKLKSRIEPGQFSGTAEYIIRFD